MRFLLILLLLAGPAAAQQRAVQAFDGNWVGMRSLQCRAGGRLQNERVTMVIRNGEVTIPGLQGDPELVGSVDAQGAVRLPRFNMFGEGAGQIRGDQFEGEHVNRSRNCLINYTLRREVTAPRRR